MLRARQTYLLLPPLSLLLLRPILRHLHEFMLPCRLRLCRYLCMGHLWRNKRQMRRHISVVPVLDG
jgi:hypothetical protein